MTNTLSSNPYELIFAAQKALFRTGATRAREWRLDQFRFPRLPVVEPTGTYLTQIRRVPEMSVDQEYALAKSWRERGDEEAERRLIASQLRLVAKIAWSYRGYGLPFFKLIHEGNRALVGAVRRFDPGRGFRLAAFARWQIEGALVEYVLAARPQVQAESAVEKMKLFFDLYRVKARLSALWNTGFHTHL